MLKELDNQELMEINGGSPSAYAAYALIFGLATLGGCVQSCDDERTKYCGGKDSSDHCGSRN